MLSIPIACAVAFAIICFIELKRGRKEFAIVYFLLMIVSIFLNGFIAMASAIGV